MGNPIKNAASLIATVSLRMAAGAFLFVGLSSIAQARLVPEIDAGQATSGLMLLIGSCLLVVDKYRKR